MTHVIKTAAGKRLLTALLLDEDAADINDLEDLEFELEEARAYACSLLDRLWSLGQELERVRVALSGFGVDDHHPSLAEWLTWQRDNPRYPLRAEEVRLMDDLIAAAEKR